YNKPIRLADDRTGVVEVADVCVLVRPATRDAVLGLSWWHTRDALAFAATMTGCWRVLRFDDRGSARAVAGAVDAVHPPSRVARADAVDGDPDGPTVG